MINEHEELVQYITTLFESEVIQNVKNRFCYLKHSLFLHIINNCPKVRKQAKMQGLPIKMLTIFDQYCIKSDVPCVDLFQLFEKPGKVQNDVMLNKIIIESYSKPVQNDTSQLSAGENTGAAASGILKNGFYRGNVGGVQTQSRRISNNEFLQDQAKKKYESQSPISRNLKNDDKQYTPDSQNIAQQAIPEAVKEMNMRQNIHKINQINKMVNARSSSEPPQPLHQNGVLNSKSLILPVEEEGDDGGEQVDHLDTNITQHDLRNQQIKTQQFVNSTDIQKEQKKRSSSSFIISNFFNGPLQNQRFAQPQLSALSSEAQQIRLQNLQGTPDQGYHVNIVPQQNSVAMTRLSRRQLSYGQSNLLSIRQQQTQKFQTASNQVIQAYGDPRDLRILNGDGAGQKGSMSRDASKDHDRSIDSELTNEQLDTIARQNQRDRSKSPAIPKLNLVQIQQDPKANRGANTSVGPSNIMQTKITTPGQGNRVQGLAIVNAGPLTSHLPKVSPSKTSNRTGLPLHILTSFNNGQIPESNTDFDEITESGPSKPYWQIRHAKSFQQQKNQLMLKLYQQSTQNNSELDQIEMIGNQSTNILEAIPSGTLNLNNTQGTQASNIIGMENGAVHNMGGALITNQNGQILGNNSFTKMAEIAAQIGESFLLKDLSCIVKQQKQMEIEDQAEQFIANQDRETPIQSAVVKRSKSVIVSGRMFLYNKKQTMSVNNLQFADCNISNNLQKDNNQLMDKVVETRLVAVNLIALMLQDYSIDEMRLINFNLQLQHIKTYLQSNFFQSKQCINQIESSKKNTIINNSFVSNIMNNLNTEQNSISKILQCFAFTNEDIMRKYINSQFQNYMGAVKPLKKEYNDKDDLFQLNRALTVASIEQTDADRNAAIVELLNNPNLLLNNNGVLYDITQTTKLNGFQSSYGVHIPKEVIRRKMDILFYSTSQNIKNLIFKQTQETSYPRQHTEGECWWWINSQFAQNLCQQISVLSYYIEDRGTSRVMLNQIIDVCMEALLMTKRVLIDVTCIQNIFIIDSTKQIHPFIHQELFQRGIVVDGQFIIPDEPNISQAADQSQVNCEMQAQMATNLMCFRQLFSQFLKLISQIISLPQSPDTLKLLNETFVGNSGWQETVKNYSISLWLQDVVSPIIVSFYHHITQNQLSLDEKYVIFDNLETLRGVNILNFEETQFMKQLEYINKESNVYLNQRKTIDLNKIGKLQIQLLLSQAHTNLDYQSAVFKFYRGAQDVFFPVHGSDVFERKENGDKQNVSNIMNGRRNTNIKNMTQDLGNQSRNDESFYNHNQSFQQNTSIFIQDKSQPEIQQNKFSQNTMTSEQKYWKDAIRKSLFSAGYWFTNTNGLLMQYLQTNGSKFKIYSDSQSNSPPVSFYLTLKALSFLEKIFKLPNKFSKYAIIEEIQVFYIRTCQISFSRLYNKNKKYLMKLKEDPRLDIVHQNHINSLKLCKAHLKCLFALAQNRTQETRLKFFTFQIVDFLVNEINLETNYKDTRKKLLNITKQKAKEQNNQDIVDFDDNISPTKKSSMHNVFQQQDNVGSDHVVKEQGYILGPTMKMPSMLNQEIQLKMNNQTSVRQVLTQEIIHEEAIQSSDSDNLPSPIPMPNQNTNQINDDSDLDSPGPYLNKKQNLLKVQILQNNSTNPNLQDIISENEYETQNSGSSDSDQGLPPPIPQQKSTAPKFSLAIGGLGLSTVANDGQQTAEQMADQKTLLKAKKKVDSSSGSDNDVGLPQVDSLSGSDSDEGLPPPLPMSKPQGLGFKLAIGGLGLSTVAADGQQTAEQMADLNTLLKAKKNVDSSASSDSYEQKPPPHISSSSGTNSDSDDGLPPPVPQQKSNAPKFNLAIGGLGLSTVAKDGNQTAEQMADQKTFLQSKNNKNESSSSDHSESDSDQGLPPPIPSFKPPGLSFKLPIGGLGLSTVAKDGQQTQEQMADQNTLLDAKNKKVNNSTSSEQSDSDSDQGLPPPIPMSKPQGLGFKLQIGGLGLSTVAKDGSKTAEQMADQNTLLQAKNAPKSSDSDTYDELGSSSSDAGLPPPIPKAKPNFNLGLNLGGLGMSTLKAEGQTMTQEEMADMNQLQQSKKQPQLSSSDSSEGNFEGGSKSSRRSKQDGQYNTIDQTEKEQLFEQRKPTEQTQPIYKLNIKNINKGALKINPSKLSGRMEPSERSNNQVIITPKQTTGNPLSIKKTRYIVNNQKQIQKLKGEGVAPNVIQQIKIQKRNEAKNNCQTQIEQKKNVKESMLIEDNISNTHAGIDSVAFQILSNQSAEGSASAQLPMDFNVEARFANRQRNEQSINLTQCHKIENNPFDQNSLRLNQVSRGKTLKLQRKKAFKISKEEFYENQRNLMPIYQDDELHSMMVSLLICLLLQPQRGTLDDLYCEQYPIMNGKENILYILHQHLSHDANQQIINKLLSQVSEIQPPLAGQRLLKLMCPQLFDLSLYNNGKDWRKLAVGAYGTVYECPTNIVKPSSVAIKQMEVPSNRDDRSVLHDIFTEITCLEEFRLEKCVTDLYDYGCDKSSYYIVMKKYSVSLGEWRRQQNKDDPVENIKVFQQNLGLYVSIYNQVLKCLRTIHSHGVTHYDIKCDNILIDFLGDTEPADLRNMTEDDYYITVGDFGECKIFSNDKDEFCTRNRGTDSIKSPEMLQIAINTRKDLDKYDRRKQVGTNRLSDIWSVGCLFYELLTGEFLLYREDYALFHCTVISDKFSLFPEEQMGKINNNRYIMDFLEFILIRDWRIRPTIDKVQQKFLHFHALLSAQISYDKQGAFQTPFNIHQTDQIKGNAMLNDCLKETAIITQQEQNNTHLFKQPEIIQILESIFLSTKIECVGELVEMGITHIILEQQQISQELQDKFEVLEIQNNQNCFQAAPIALDFIRKQALYRGRLLFVESSQNKMKEILVIVLNHLFKTNTFETYNLIKSQNLFFQIEINQLAEICKWSYNVQKVKQYLVTFPQFSCHCGGSLLILERQFADYQKIQQNLIRCNCSGGLQSNCPCGTNVSCTEYLNFLVKYYSAGRSSKGTHISQCPINSSQSQLLWGLFDPQDFVICPNEGDFSTFEHQESSRSRMSRKTNIVNGLTVPSLGLENLKNRASISDRQSSTRTQISKTNPYERQIAFNISMGTDRNCKDIGNAESPWKINKCKICNCWVYAYNANLNKFAVLLNNRISPQYLNSQGLFNQTGSDNQIWTNMEIVKHQFSLIEQEYLNRQQSNSSANAGAAPHVQQMFTQNQETFISENLKEENEINNKVKVPVLKNICIQLPY